MRSLSILILRALFAGVDLAMFNDVIARPIRTVALARHTVTLHEGMFLVGTVYNFCTPHASLSHTQKATPAMAAGITGHCWTMYELLSFHVPLSRWVPPKRRGRPSRALQELIKRWCS